MTLALDLLLDVSLCFLFFVLMYLVLLSLPTTPIPLRLFPSVYSLPQSFHSSLYASPPHSPGLPLSLSPSYVIWASALFTSQRPLVLSICPILTTPRYHRELRPLSTISYILPRYHRYIPPLSTISHIPP